ncbi:unnamed protein product, partial [Prunus brigantina]
RLPPPLRFSSTQAATSKSCRRRHTGPQATGPDRIEPPPLPLPSRLSPAASTAAASPESAENGLDFQKIQTSRSPSFLNQIGRVRYSDHAYSAGSLGLSPVATELRSRADRVLPIF